MGMKLLSAHNMVSWSCFHLVKNAIPGHQQHQQPIANIKLIHSDGVVKIYHRPINVSEVLLEFPKHSVCRSDSFYIGQKTPPLSDQDQLQLGQKYFLLPTPFFHSVLSFVTIASVFSPPNSNSINNNNNNARFINNAALCQHPFDIQRTDSGCVRIRVSDDFISQLLEQSNPKIQQQQQQQQSSSLPLGKICTTPQLAKDYTQLVRKRQWKPKLDTIPEIKKKKISSFGFNKKKNPFHSHSKPPPSPPRKPTGLPLAKSTYSLNHLRSIHFAYKPKIRIKLKVFN